MLPRLPIPKLEDTVQRYLESLEPLLPLYASRAGRTVEEVRRMRYKYAEEFLAPGGLGRRLQQRLIGEHKVALSRDVSNSMRPYPDLDNASPNNWLNDTIWMKVAYLEQRDPLVVNSNWWLMLENDVTVPEGIRNGTHVEAQACRKWQIRRAAWLTKRFLDYRDLLLELVTTGTRHAGQVHPFIKKE